MAPPGLGTTGPHVVVPALPDDADEVVVAGEEAHHLATVLRIRAGDAVSLTDGRGSVAQATVRQAARDGVVVGVDRRSTVPAPTPAVCVVQALPKARKMDEVVQRLTELGVDRIRPVVTSRTVKQVDGKADRVQDRWRAVALAATRQSRRAWLPAIEPIAAWPPSGSVGVVLWEEAVTPLAEALAPVLAARPAEVVLAIGPEGGFAAEEVAAATDLVPAALGSTILRTEVAGVVAASIALHLTGRLG